MKNKFTKIITLLGIFCVQISFAQKNIGIGTTSPDQSAVLEVFSKSGGVLLPRLSYSDRENIKNPANGLLVFQTDNSQGFYYFNDNKWNAISTTEAYSVAAANPDNWSLTGNSGLNHNTNFLGSPSGSNVPIQFKVNGVRAGFIDIVAGSSATGYTYTGNGSLFLGVNSGLNNTGGANVGLGADALKLNTSGTSNFAIGTGSLSSNTTGFANTGIGRLTLRNNTTGVHNTAIGEYSLQANTVGASNIGIGVHSGYNLSGNSNRNVFIGHSAGNQLLSGNNNVFIGYLAGSLETNTSDKLYISNSNTLNPLVKGDFSANTLKINSKTTGYLAVGDFDAGEPMPTPTGYRLIVQDGILTEKVKVAVKTTDDWADYVFEEDYKLLPLSEVEKFTKEFNHLPNVPSAQDMAEGGLDIGETSKMFMEKIEELTLYMIKLSKEVEQLKLENAELKATLNK